MKEQCCVLAVGLLVLSQAVSRTEAQTSNSVYSVVVGSEPIDIKGIKQGDAITFASTSDDCVCCSISALRYEQRLEFSSVQDDPYGGSTLYDISASIKSRGLGTPATVKSSLYSGDNEVDVRSRVCFSTGRSNYRLTVGSVGAAPADATAGFDARVQCSSNALYGTFNLNGSDFSFLEIHSLGGDLWVPPQNPNRSDVEVSVNLNSVASTSGGAAAQQDADISTRFAQTTQYRQDVALHDKFTPGSWGTLKLCHDGAPGAVQGSVKRYKITSTNPLDFTLVGSEQLAPR